MRDPAVESAAGPDNTPEIAGEPTAPRRAGKRATAFRTIGEVAGDLDLPPHVLRFWESKFPQIKPLKRGGGRRYYRPEDVDLLRRIRQCLYQDGYTIRGVQKLLRDGASPAPAGEAAPNLFPLEPAPPAAAKRAAPRKARSKPAPREAVTQTLEDLRRELLAARALLIELQNSRS